MTHRGAGRAAAAATALLAGVLALGALGAAGCARRGAAGTVTLRMWAMGREGEVVQELVRDFERQEPGVRVIVQQIPWSAAHEKLLTGFVGRSTPDVSQLGNTWIAEFHALNALAPLDARVAASPVVSRDDYFPGIWDTNVVDGVTWGVPWYVDTRVLFYRRDLMVAAGFDSMPGSWDRWRDALAAIARRGGPGHYGIFLPANEWTAPVVLGLSAGSPLLKDHDTRGAFSEPAFARAFRFYIGLFRGGLAPPMSNNEIANLYQEFERGTFGQYITGPWNLGEFARRLPPGMQDDWDTAPLPGPSGRADGISTAGGSSLVVFRASDHPDEAWRLVEFLSRPEQQVRFFELCGDLPARRAAWSDTAVTHDPKILAFRDQLERVRPTPKVPEWELIATRLQEQAERAIRGVVPPDTALAELDREVDRILEKRRWLLERRLAAGGGGAP